MKGKYESRSFQKIILWMFQGQDILNSFNFKVSILPFSKMLLFCYYTKKNMIIYEVDISQTKCFDLKYHLETNLSFPKQGESKFLFY